MNPNSLKKTNPKMVLIAFDPLKVDAQKFHEVVTTLPKMTGWWHYMSSTYIITTHANRFEIEGNILSQMGPVNFFFSEIKGETRGGYLPKVAWTWIDERKN